MSAAAGTAPGRRVLVLGGTSEIALAIVGELRRRAPRDVALLARNGDAVAGAAATLGGGDAERTATFTVDALATDTHGAVIERAVAELGGVDIAIVAVGVLGDRGGLPQDIAKAVEVLNVNTVGAGSLTLHAARALRDGGGGTLVVLSSVAAERPRRANVVYGASKAGLDALARGLADDLHDQGVRVMVVRPGFVRTRMTRGLDPAPLATDPHTVAQVVADGIDRHTGVVWAPRPLRWLMLVVRLLPAAVFRRMKQ